MQPPARRRAGPVRGWRVRTDGAADRLHQGAKRHVRVLACQRRGQRIHVPARGVKTGTANRCDLSPITPNTPHLRAAMRRMKTWCREPSDRTELLRDNCFAEWNTNGYSFLVRTAVCTIRISLDTGTTGFCLWQAGMPKAAGGRSHLAWSTQTAFCTYCRTEPPSTKTLTVQGQDVAGAKQTTDP